MISPEVYRPYVFEPAIYDKRIKMMFSNRFVVKIVRAYEEVSQEDIFLKKAIDTTHRKIEDKLQMCGPSKERPPPPRRVGILGAGTH
jgi:hypothetical protein